MITYTHSFAAEDWIRLRNLVGWNALSLRQARQGINGIGFNCAAQDNGRTIAIARIIYDGSYIGYISDVIVEPEYQGQGIGRHLVEELLTWFKTQLEPGEYAQISLSSAKGKESFYQKLGFIARPNEDCGAGMMMRIIK